MNSNGGRQSVLDAAAKAVLSDRNKAYGNPEDNFKNIAEVWNWWFSQRQDKLTTVGVSKVHFTSSDVAYMMILMKMARLKTNPTHFDSVVDVAGYAACAADCFPPPIEKSLGSYDYVPSGMSIQEFDQQRKAEEAERLKWQSDKLNQTNPPEFFK